MENEYFIFMGNCFSFMIFIVIIPEMWSPSKDWTVTDLPSVYRSFDNYRYVRLENGAVVADGWVSHFQIVTLLYIAFYLPLILILHGKLHNAMS